MRQRRLPTLASLIPTLLLLLSPLPTNATTHPPLTVGTQAIDDIVTNLPSFGPPPTPHFSGYLDASAGCDTETNGPICRIHYWLALAEHPDPVKAPTVLWLNGGPGSSSMIGFLQELGPLLISAKGDLMSNPWGWTKHANVVAIEAPIGVGYSYCSRQADGDGPCVNTDRYTASASRAAMVDFFTRKFPELRDGSFYIVGESYAGVYIPTLSKEILDHTDLNLRGIAVGDPCTDNKAQADSMDSLWYANKYGLVDEEIYNVLKDQCDIQRLPNLMFRGGLHHVVHTANEELRSIENLEERKARASELYDEMVLSGAFSHIRSMNNDNDYECNLAMHKFLASSSRGLSQSWLDLYIDDYSLFAPVTDLEDEQMEAYMSRPDVRKALHVEDAPTPTWPMPPVGFSYEKEYKACNWNDEITLDISMVDIYQEIVPKLKRTWIYNGDTDPCVSYEGTRLAVKQILLPELDGGSYRPWFYNHTAAPSWVIEDKSALFGPNLVRQNLGAQFGGEITSYEKGLSFVTFHGSGHMVPQFRPQAALHFLEKFLMEGEEEMLSPLLPKNETVAGMTGGEWKTFMEKWTESAMGPPFVTAAIENSYQKKNAKVVNPHVSTSLN